VRPSSSTAIPLTWAQLHYSLSPGKEKDSTNAFGTTRKLRSAASFYYLWDMQIAYPGQAMRDLHRRGIIVPYSSPTDEMIFTIQNGGMARRMGTAVRSSWALQHRHIKFIDDQLLQAYHSAPSDQVRHEIAAAGTANMLLWLGWLRGGECFSLQRDDVKVIHPAEGPRHGLPLGVGYIDIRLLPETKSSPHRVADVVVSYYSASGFSLGLWMDRLLLFAPHDGASLFSTSQHPQWDSTLFRTEYAWPLLELLRIQGDPSLMAFSDTPGHRIRDKVWACHSWRRGTESFVRKHRPGLNIRAATKDEQYEHARWRRKRNQASEAIDVHYTEMELDDRLAITLLCE